jgi:hypothetical protein
MIFIDSIYINSSGGKYLLEYFIQKISEQSNINEYIFLFDNRFVSNKTNLIPSQNIYYSNSSEFSRYASYKKLFKKYSIRSLFCFSNVPPPFLFNTHCEVFVYFHNVLLIESWRTNYSFKLKLLFFLKSVYIHFTASKNLKWIVQTSLVKSKLSRYFNIDSSKIYELPFFDNSNVENTEFVRDQLYFYPAEGIPQKNHKLLINVWEKLSVSGIFPTLVLTIDELKFPEIIKEVNRLKSHNINIINIGFVSREEILHQYRKSKFLIFPSLNESFGLPLVEAANHGCHVIAPNLEYVNNVLETNAKFDTNSTDLFELIRDIETNKLQTISPIIKIDNKIALLIQLLNDTYV